MLNMAMRMSSLALSAVLSQAAGDVSLQQALDRPVTLQVTDATIQQVFDLIAASSGAKIEVHKDTFQSLPYGDQTRLSVKLANATLRRKLGPMLSGLALEWKIVADAVHIVPSEALYRIGRRATYDELSTLAAMQTAPLKPSEEGGPVLDQLCRATGAKDLEMRWQVIAADEDKQRAMRRAEKALPGTGAAWLEMLCHGQGWTWYLWGDDILIVDRQTQLRRQLNTLVSLRYQNAELVNVLHDLARQARVMLLLEPGVIKRLPSETRTNFNLIMADASVAQALEVISGATGLQFVTTDDGLRVSAGPLLRGENEPTSAPARNRAPFFVKFSVPSPEGRTVEVFMRGDELPEDLQRAILAEKEQLIVDLRKSLKVRPVEAGTNAE